MPENIETANDGSDEDADGGRSHEIDSRFRLIVVAALRSKQLLHGSRPRVEADPKRRRNTSIALEEVRRGLVPFTTGGEDRGGDGAGAESSR
jgi:DNA-directed RNA polymerase omega subunit